MLSRSTFRAAAGLLAGVTALAVALAAFTSPGIERPRASARARGEVVAGVADSLSVRERAAVAERVASSVDGDTTEVYRGLGTWIDIYDDAWDHPGVSVRDMAAAGVRTLYLQTSNFSRRSPFVHHPAGVAAFVDAAERNGIRTVAWYLPGFRDLELDLKRSLAAIGFETSGGNSFDSFAMDIESPEVVRPSVRTRRTMQLSERIRRIVGQRYPLGAIIPSPLRMEVDHGYWPGFPYRGLARVYDVILPMTYFTYRVNGPDGAHAYTAGNIDIIRRQTGNKSVPIHVIGGIGGDATEAETAGFVDAVRGRRAIGGSYYTFPITRPADWSKLERLRSTR